MQTTTVTTSATSTTVAATSPAMHAWRALISTRAEASTLVARLALAGVMLPHGLQKTLGWFGGYGFEGTMGFFTQTMGIPYIFALAAVLAESVGAVALLLGFGARLMAASLGVVLAVAAITVHWQHGFFMNWFGNQKGEGIEFFVFGLGLALVVVLRGAGALSLDRLLPGGCAEANR